MGYELGMQFSRPELFKMNVVDLGYELGMQFSKPELFWTQGS